MHGPHRGLWSDTDGVVGETKRPQVAVGGIWHSHLALRLQLHADEDARADRPSKKFKLKHIMHEILPVHCLPL